MIYLLDRLDFNLFDLPKRINADFDFWETDEERVKTWIENERCRSVFSKAEIINLFKPKKKIQMVRAERLRLKNFDKIIFWTDVGRYFVLEIKNIMSE